MKPDSSHQLGHFWPTHRSLPNFADAPERGVLTFHDGYAHLETLDDNPVTSHSRDIRNRLVDAISGRSTDSSMLLLEVAIAGFTTLMGDRASTLRYTARSVIEDVHFAAVRSHKLRKLQANFLGLGNWTELSASTEHPEYKSDGRLKAWTVTLSSEPEATTRLTQGRDLTLATSWSVDGPSDLRTVRAPITLTCSSKRPRDTWDLLSPLLNVQDLAGLAYSGFVAAETGRAELDYEIAQLPKYAKSPSFWNGALMTVPTGVRTPKSMSEFPSFYLDDIGGLAGIARWIRLCELHPRAVHPVTDLYRVGSAVETSALISVAVGIEYWVCANRAMKRPSPQWTQQTRLDPKYKPNSKGKNFALALAKHVGTDFDKWTGDLSAWACDFWDCYNGLKHDPRHNIDPSHTADLAASGRALLTAALLNRTAGRRTPGQQLLHGHRLNWLGARLKARYL